MGHSRLTCLMCGKKWRCVEAEQCECWKENNCECPDCGSVARLPCCKYELWSVS